MHSSVFIEGGSMFCPYATMFSSMGFKILANPANADVICFTGGHDVCPDFYGEDTHPYTSYNEHRDTYCKGLYESYLGEKFFVGICRGSQFLNVMNGGSLYQHVNNHTMNHDVYDAEGNNCGSVSSTHHQMMMPTKKAELLLHAGNLATMREHTYSGQVDNSKHPDTESVYYRDTKSFCFQPHPEFYNQGDNCYELFKKLFLQKLGE